MSQKMNKFICKKQYPRSRLIVSIMIDKRGVDHWKKVFGHGG
ncbi:hypothetical protein OXIME_000771 [Oxyplasma meridianum]|uniref:Uncharacterized protein n=1 Tax=Oxyplasma meridianum TaxID=3073602 RepID=A0AAX4NFD9_9ARCH